MTQNRRWAAIQSAPFHCSNVWATSLPITQLNWYPGCAGRK